jgi:hypothetical protein
MIQQRSSTDGTNDLVSSLRPNRCLDICLQYRAGIPLWRVGEEAIVMRSIGFQTLPDERRLSSQRLSALGIFWPNSNMTKWTAMDSCRACDWPCDHALQTGQVGRQAELLPYLPYDGAVAFVRGLTKK